MLTLPRILTKLEMRSEEEGGRREPFWESYRPHLIPEGTEDYLGVSVVGLTEEQAVHPGTTAEVEFDLVYYPNVDYSALCVGTEFEIREGAKVVGTGMVISKNDS